MNDFYAETQVLLDPIYTAKMVFGVRSLMDNGFFPDNTRILMIHTGGIQGIIGMNALLKKKKLATINRDD